MAVGVASHKAMFKFRTDSGNIMKLKGWSWDKKELIHFPYDWPSIGVAVEMTYRKRFASVRSLICKQGWRWKVEEIPRILILFILTNQICLSLTSVLCTDWGTAALRLKAIVSKHRHVTPGNQLHSWSWVTMAR